MSEPSTAAGRSASSLAAGPRTRAFVRFTLAHGKVLWLVAVLVAIPALVRTVRLYMHLKSDLEELLPREAASVVAIDELRSRMPGLQYLGVLVDAGDPKNVPAAERMLDDLAARVRKYPPSLVRSVRLGVHEERSFVEAHAPLYADLDDLKTIRSRIEARRDWEATRAMGADFDDDEPPPKLDFSDIENKHADERGQLERFDHDRFSSTKLGMSLLLVEVGAFSTGSESGGALLDRIKADLADLGGPERYAPGMRIGYTGDVAINVEELAALVSDLTISSVLVVLAVLGVIVYYYRWWRSVPILLLPLSLATLYSFALVTLPPFRIEGLNSNTAFLGSVIVGNGINFGIMLLARYREERRSGATLEDALVTAVWGTRVGTVVASAAAAIAYGSLVLTQFRGFRQFGVIGGVGMLVCWGVSFLLIPPLVALLDRNAPVAVDVREEGGIMHVVARFVARRPGLVVGVAAALTVASLWLVRGFGRSRIEYDFSKLRRGDSALSGEAYWGKKMDALLGRYLSPIVLLTDGPDETRELAAAVREAVKRPPLADLVASVQTVDDALPREQEAKIREAKAIRADLTPKIRALIPEERRADVDRYLGESGLSKIAARDLPASFTSGLREFDGALDRAVLVYPRPSDATWQGDAIKGLARDLRALAAAHPGRDGRPARVAGSAPLSADIIASVEHDGPLATAAALLGVVALVALIFRASAPTPLIVGSLCLGVLWLAASTIAFDVKINFCNFIAFPITFGIGVDYAVNVMARYVQGGSRDVSDAIRSTGGAVGLASLTTIIGYGSLLLAKNQALFLFGVVAVLGEVACLVTAVVVLPAVLLVARRDVRAAEAKP